MSKKNRPVLSLRGDPNVPTTEPLAPAPEEPNAPIQEKIMEAATEKTSDTPELTTKQMAAAEEAEAARLKQISDEQQQEPVSVIGLAAQGMDVLHDALRKHAAQTAPKPYTPPPMTERQLSQREAELEAGRRAQQKAQAQFDSRPIEKPAPNEGFTTPVHRPGDFVPNLNSRDPAIS